MSCMGNVQRERRGLETSGVKLSLMSMWDNHILNSVDTFPHIDKKDFEEIIEVKILNEGNFQV